MGVQPARDHAHEEPVQHARRLAAEHAHEVEDVLDDREAEPADGAVDEPVHHVVDLVARDQVDQHDPEPLRVSSTNGAVSAAVHRDANSGPPTRATTSPQPAFADRRQRGGGDRAPHERRDHQRDRLALVEIEEVDDQDDRQRVEDQERPRQGPPARRHLG